LGLLVAAYTFNFIDRTIISTIGQAIKTDLKISDTQLGLLGGLYFALLYTVLGLPLARLAERMSRVNIIAGAVVVWSGFTALCGTAGSFATLAALRFGVGVGEAGLSPPAHSLISDYFTPRQRASALSIYSLGIPIGTMIGAIVGGWLTQRFSWRVAFVLVGLPGLLIALALKLIVREPRRGQSDFATAGENASGAAPPPPLSLRGELGEIGAVCAILFGSWPVLNLMLGVTLASFAGYGAGAFVPAHFVRTFGLDFTHVGLVYGLIYGVSPGLGALGAGFLADRLGRRHVGWYVRIPALGLLLGAPIYIWAFTQPTWQATALAQILPLLLIASYLGPTFGVVQNLVEPRRRATATAILFFVLNLFTLGAGPPLTGWIIDQFAGFNFAHPHAASTWSSLVNLTKAHATAFQAACPGGAALRGATAGMVAQCHNALALATRQGVMVALAFYLWAGVHYLLASFGLPRALSRATTTG
jgi:MFS family permease